MEVHLVLGPQRRSEWAWLPPKDPYFIGQTQHGELQSLVWPRATLFTFLMGNTKKPNVPMKFQFA